MTSERKIAANRRNSSRSTGPRTAYGKARARRNALRHGLAAIGVSESAISVEINRLAALICSKDADPVIREQALIIAEGSISLSRVRAARAAVLEQMSGVAAAPVPDALKSTTRLGVMAGSYLGQLVRLERYERRAFSRRKRAMRAIFPSEGGRCAAHKHDEEADAAK
jgi:hypothetical protein